MSATPSDGPVEPGAEMARTRELTANERVGYYVEMWKKAVDVQQHFNDIQWRIRGLALTVATFALGAAGLSAREGTRVAGISLGTLVALVGLLLWYAFYFADRVWYHPLLKSAVDSGTVMEEAIREHLPEAGMTTAITAGSPQDMGWLTKTLSRKKRMHSVDKLVWFYQVGGAAFIIVAVALQVGVIVDSWEARQEAQVPVETPVSTKIGAPEIP